MDLHERWEAHATEWIAWARADGHDSYWRFHRDQFLQIVPAPGCRTVDIGCGEGRLTRHLKKLGHDIVGVDASPSLVAAAREHSALLVMGAYGHSRLREWVFGGFTRRILRGAEIPVLMAH